MEDPAGFEYRVKFALGGKGGSSAFYAQSPTSVKKILDGCAKRGQRILSVQEREVGDWSEFDGADLERTFGVRAEPPDWAP